MDATTDLLSLYQDCGRVDEAIMAIKDALKIHEFEQEHASRLFFYLGQLSEQKRDFRKALEYYLKSIHIGSQEKHLKYYQNNNAGFCLNYLMEFKAARRFCMRATKISPKYYNAWKNLGVSFEHLGMIFDAATCYARSQWLEPSDPRARKHLDRLIFRNPHLFPVSSN